MRARFGTDVVCSQCGKRLRGHQGVTRGYHVNAHKGLGGTPCIGASLTDHLPAVSEKKATA